MNRVGLSFWILFCTCLGEARVSAASQLTQFMPQSEDFALLCWANGPQSYLGAKASHSEPVIFMQSGTIGFAIDTKTLRILHAGTFPKRMDMQNALRSGDAAVASLPSLSF